MSRRKFATRELGAATVERASSLRFQLPDTRIPDRIVIDVFALINIALVVLAAMLAKSLYIAMFRAQEQGHETYLVAGLAGGLVVQYLMRARKLHAPPAILAWRERIGELVMTVGLSFLMLTAMAFLLKISAVYSRGWLLTWFCFSALLLMASRPAYAHLLDWLAATGYTIRRVAVVGDGIAREQLVRSLRSMSGVRVAGVFAARAKEREGEPGETIDDLIAMGQRDEFDEVVVALSSSPQPCTTQLVEELSVLPVDVWLCPAELGLPILATSRLGALSLLQVQPKPIRDWGYLAKLAFDYTTAAVCVVLFAPLMLIIALAIKLDSPGPIMFRQRRHGFNHRVIDIFKFRTMTVAENDGRVEQARENDPRVTRIGRLLRKTSLDELPQLFNVLRGEMSLVGPRPHALAHNQHYRDKLDRYASRHCVKPGMTGWAQINGLRGPTEDPEKMRLRVLMDLYYIENWSLWLDLKIIAATPFVGFVHRNAL
jgi:putative colanic acid biosynthesis UDP-glucose lipid carrier transferase